MRGSRLTCSASTSPPKPRQAWSAVAIDWSESGTVKQTVIDSNVVEPGSTWGLRITPREGGGRNVEMTLERGFRRGPAGRFGSILNHLGGCRGWGFYLRRALKAVERASAAEPAGTR
jgi:hypothetical protein